MSEIKKEIKFAEQELEQSKNIIKLGPYGKFEAFSLRFYKGGVTSYYGKFHPSMMSVYIYQLPINTDYVWAELVFKSLDHILVDDITSAVDPLTHIWTSWEIVPDSF